MASSMGFRPLILYLSTSSLFIFSVAAQALPDSASDLFLHHSSTFANSSGPQTDRLADSYDVTNNPGTNARIPVSLSPTCQSYLARLNAHNKVQTCIAPLLNATSPFFNQSSQPATPDQIKSTFDALCHTQAGCEPRLIRSVLNHLAGNCTNELQTNQPSVKQIYDVLYILIPYRVAICAQDPQSGAYCPSVIASAVVNKTAISSDSKSKDFKVMSPSDFGSVVTSVLSNGHLAQSDPHSPATNSSALLKDLRRRGAEPATLAVSGNQSHPGSAGNPQYHPNSETYTSTNLAFLLLHPDLPPHVLCTPCTQAVLASYIGFEQAAPYLGGLSSSGYLSGQVKLWKSVHERCGSLFSESINQAAGIMSSLTETSPGIHLIGHALFNFDFVNILVFSLTLVSLSSSSWII